MALTYSSFVFAPLPSTFPRPPSRLSTRVKFSFNQLPPLEPCFGGSFDFEKVVSRAEGLLYTLADTAVVAADSTAPSDAATQKSGGWFGFISEAMEFVLKVMVFFVVEGDVYSIFHRLEATENSVIG